MNFKRQFLCIQFFLPFHFKSNLVSEFRVDQSISHNGVCLTVVDISDDIYVVTAINETLNKSNLGELEIGDSVNIERSMLANGRLDGHIVLAVFECS